MAGRASTSEGTWNRCDLLKICVLALALLLCMTSYFIPSAFAMAGTGQAMQVETLRLQPNVERACQQPLATLERCKSAGGACAAEAKASQACAIAAEQAAARANRECALPLGQLSACRRKSSDAECRTDEEAVNACALQSATRAAEEAGSRR